MRSLRTTATAFIAILFTVAILGVVTSQDPESQYAKLTREGESVYNDHCSGCHGVNGDGQGPAARFLDPKPRDFTPAIFKFRTTPSGSLPTDEDLYRTITRGLHRTAMPEFSLLADRQRLALVAYLKTFSEIWQIREPRPPIFIPEPPAWLGEANSVARGKEVYAMVGCNNCHGETGKGDGSSVATMQTDSWGYPQRPFDFTKGGLKSGGSVKDIYRTFMTGLNGTAMPSYADFFQDIPQESPLSEDDIWHLISYVVSLRQTNSSNQ